MPSLKILVPAALLALTASSCVNKNYNCVCADDFCGTPWVRAELTNMSKHDAKTACNAHDTYDPETGLTVNCEIEEQ